MERGASPLTYESKVITMKKHLQVTILTALLLILNPYPFISPLGIIEESSKINKCNPIGPISSMHPINSLSSSAWAQESSKEPAPGLGYPAHHDMTTSTDPSQIHPVDVSGDYVIGKGDVLRVFIWRNEQLQGQVVVRPDGKISLPLLQDLQAEGLTGLELQKEITRRFSEHLTNPRVTVIVNQINSYKVSVLGKVASPGVYPITGDTTFVEAISMAGGFTEWANRRKITVITHQEGKKKKITINYKKIASGKDPNQNIILKRGDTIIVP
jgi:polysaccharide export outer membrane protein